MLVLLLAAGADPDQKRHDLATPLWIAAQMGHDHIVKTLLQHGAFVDSVRVDGATPLFKASHKGHAHVVHELLKYKPKLGLLPNGETCLHAAALFGHLPVVKQLVATGSCNINQRNQDNLTASQIARQENHMDVYQYLVEKESSQRSQHSSSIPRRQQTNGAVAIK